MSKAFSWESGKSPSIWVKGAKRYKVSIENAVLATFRARQGAVQSWMRTYAKWNDRSRRARQGLIVHTFFDRRLGWYIYLELASTVPYALELELKNSGEYAVIRPTLDYWSDILWEDIKRLFRR